MLLQMTGTENVFHCADTLGQTHLLQPVDSRFGGLKYNPLIMQPAAKNSSLQDLK